MLELLPAVLFFRLQPRLPNRALRTEEADHRHVELRGRYCVLGEVFTFGESPSLIASTPQNVRVQILRARKVL